MGRRPTFLNLHTRDMSGSCRHWTPNRNYLVGLRRRRNLPCGFILVLKFLGIPSLFKTESSQIQTWYHSSIFLTRIHPRGGGAPFEKLELAFRNELTQTLGFIDVGIVVSVSSYCIFWRGLCQIAYPVTDYFQCSKTHTHSSII